MLLPGVLDMLRILSHSGTPAMRARGRFLLKNLERAQAKRFTEFRSGTSNMRKLNN